MRSWSARRADGTSDRPRLRGEPGRPVCRTLHRSVRYTASVPSTEAFFMPETTATQSPVLRVGHSPDPDDAFMFYGLAKGGVKIRDYRIEHVLEDIESLNRR